MRRELRENFAAPGAAHLRHRRLLLLDHPPAGTAVNPASHDFTRTTRSPPMSTPQIDVAYIAARLAQIDLTEEESGPLFPRIWTKSSPISPSWNPMTSRGVAPMNHPCRPWTSCGRTSRSPDFPRKRPCQRPPSSPRASSARPRWWNPPDSSLFHASTVYSLLSMSSIQGTWPNGATACAARNSTPAELVNLTADAIEADRTTNAYISFDREAAPAGRGRGRKQSAGGRPHCRQGQHQHSRPADALRLPPALPYTAPYDATSVRLLKKAGGIPWPHEHG